MADFTIALNNLLGHEGQYGNDPNDPGGETYEGISRKMQPNWLGWHIIDLIKTKPGFPNDLNAPDLIEIKKQLDYEVRSFYINEYWLPIQGDKILNQDIAESIFDFAVNAGLKTSCALAQTVVSATNDGKIGKESIEKINSCEVNYFNAAFTLMKIVRYVHIVKKRPASRKYFFGWICRAIDETN